MFREYFILLLLGHILGDFYFQTKGLAEKKEKSKKWVLLHCLSYWGTMLLIVLPVISYEIILAVTLASIIHLVIDTTKYTYPDEVLYESRKNVFLGKIRHEGIGTRIV